MKRMFCGIIALIIFVSIIGCDSKSNNTTPDGGDLVTEPDPIKANI